MGLSTLIGVCIVVAGVVLLLASAAAIAADKPASATGDTASATIQAWCPVVGALTRVGLDRAAGSPHLTVLSCERFPDGPVECDRACIATRLAA